VDEGLEERLACGRIPVLDDGEDVGSEGVEVVLAERFGRVVLAAEAAEQSSCSDL
jgi:hypothetical protein